ncbi:hypothetical protein ABNB59_11105 [Paenibacillus larvae]|uniref:Uncharacterized protein n=1 Tax=Paenibacillus larvae TaxID=1464 RepID=A0AAP5JUE5_9BACL|nr:hypothetical protein [Paenibacillus larvae]AVF20759.1 hypothetical protein ERICI_00846 [Paenibacillus larvae subsp. larvae]ETK28276.1 hypothetical protein ERIC1_1c17380 [Paenibacillus larvae subsp. larvae DSM 25719]MCY7475892.1 hypothetical protein [Paenibacillus larvae]MCY7491172.1 hypothetical protein [Paenibacillus larvae]MCY9564358.1 hypothetical protein [Paenibacillus larvae]
MFNEVSICVDVWCRAVVAGVYPYSEVPDLYNLREIVGKKLGKMEEESESVSAK